MRYGIGRYILDEKGNPKEEPDLMKWAEWFEAADRFVAKTKTWGSEVSTVFIGLDHSFGMGVPLLYETMVFGGKLDGEMNRYATKEEAEAGHKEMVERVKKS